MEKEAIDEMLKVISAAPESQMDPSITKKIKDLIGKPVSEIKTGVMHSIDLSVRGGLASEFAMRALLTLHEVYLDGKDSDFNDENCPWRKEN